MLLAEITEWEKIAGALVLILNTVATLYVMFKKERRTDVVSDEERKKAEDERDIRLAGAWKKAWQETVDRYGKEQARWTADRDKMEKEVHQLKSEVESYEKQIDKIKEDCESVRVEVRSLRAENALLRGKVAYMVRLLQKNGIDPGTDEHPPLTVEEK
jgi:peptidoglycan hydrolase CwlO-like protein